MSDLKISLISTDMTNPLLRKKSYFNIWSQYPQSSSKKLNSDLLVAYKASTLQAKRKVTSGIARSLSRCGDTREKRNSPTLVSAEEENQWK